MAQVDNRSVRSKSSLWSILKILLGLALAALVITRTDLEQMLALRQQISWPYLWLSVGLFFLLSALKAWQYYRLLEARVTYPQALSTAILQNAISNFVATGAGVVTFMAVLKAEQGVKLSRSASVFILLKICDMASLWLGLILSLPFLGGQAAPMYYSILVLVILIGAGLLVFGVGLSNRRNFSRIIRGLLERASLVRFGFVQKGLQFLDSLAGFDQQELSRLVWMAARLSLVYLMATVAWSYASLHTFGLPVSVWVVVFATAMLQLLSILPVQVLGGLGVTEAASLYLFGLFGFPEAGLAAVLIGNRLLFYLENLAVLIYLPVNSLFSSRRAEARKE